MIKTYAEKEITKGWLFDALISLINEMFMYYICHSIRRV